MPDKELRTVSTLSEAQCVRTMHQISKRFTKLHQHVRDFRRPHFYNEESVGPKLAEPLAHIDYQSDYLRQTWTKLKARLMENHGVVHVTPKHQSSDSREADDVEATLNAMWAIIEERNGTTLQGDMADGQIVDAYAILHWYRMDQSYPQVPEYEYLDELPQDSDDDDYRTRRKNSEKRKRFREWPEYEGEHKGKYRETDKSLRERSKYERATAGSPYHMEVPDFYSVFFSRDALYDVGPVLHVKRVPLIDYNDELQQYGKALSMEDSKAVLKDMRKGLESTPGEAPPTDSPSGGDFGKTITVATLWTKSEWYELCSEREFTPETEMVDGWTLVKSGRHGFGRPPFEIIPAQVFNSQDPLERYLPALEGVFRTKPNHDRSTAITMGLAERTALPEVWFEKVPNSEPALTDDGQDVRLGKDTQNAGNVPEGYSLKQMQLQVGAAQIQMRDQSQVEMENSAPAVGQAEVDGRTQPWTARIGVAQANVEPAMYMDSQVRGLRAAFRSIMRDISTSVEDGGFGEEVVVYGRDKDGHETDKLVGISPEDVETLFVDVDINPTSAMERITATEHLAGLLERQLIQRVTFYEEGMGIADATDYMYDLDAEKLVEQYLKPGAIAQAIAEEYGSQAIFTPDGRLVGLNGAEMDPNQMMADRGFQPAQQQTMPPLVDQPAPGQAPLSGLG